MGGKDDDDRRDFDRMMSDARKEVAKAKKDMDRVMNDMELPLSTIDHYRKIIKATDPTDKGAFERFKSFVDTNLSLLADGFTNFPQNVRDLKLKMQQEREARQAEEIDIWRRWTGSDDSPDYIKMQIERPSRQEKTDNREATMQLLQESYERNKNVSPEKIVNLFEDDADSFVGFLDRFATPMLSFGGACYYKPETVDNLPSTARWGWPTPTYAWLSTEWFKRSPYSPIRLEAQPGLADEGAKWRAAFEELLLDALGKPMNSSEQIGQRMWYGNPQSTYRGPGLDWMLSLQCRGILPPQLPNFYKQYQRKGDGERDFSRPSTEFMMSDLNSLGWGLSPYDRAKGDIQTLMDEVGIKAQPRTDAFTPTPQPARVESSPSSLWRVPDTEAELYEQMPPQTSSQTALEDYQTQLMLLEAANKERLLQARREADSAGQSAEEFEEMLDRERRLEDALVRAEKLGYDFEDWDWENLPLDVLEGELEREEAYTAARRQTALTKAAKLGFDLCEWEKENLPVQALEDRLLRVEENAKRDATAAVVQAEGKRPDVLSQLTTTETTRLPDGTVTTKVVLKRRFADGSEETKESVHTSNEVLEREAAEKAAKLAEGHSQEKKGGGWFWK